MMPHEYEILLVEDDPADAELTVLSLRREGLANHIVIARDGVIRKKVIGADDWGSPGNQALIAQLLQEPAS